VFGVGVVDVVVKVVGIGVVGMVVVLVVVVGRRVLNKAETSDDGE
jgi:hypothetical protein